MASTASSPQISITVRRKNSNAIVTVADGGVLWQIMAPTGFQQMNHGGLYASWDKSERFVLWTVEGKWFPRSLLLIDLEGERLDLKKICQDELLQQARSAFPQAYEATKKAGGMGEAYPDGFTLDFQYERREMLTFPLTLAIGLTNDPKLMRQANAEFAARYLSVTMTAQVTEDLEVTFSDVAVQGPLRAPTE
ncbi:MAG: hypothetical protein AAF191_07325 [Verrucomicrobiota bacterium]